MSVEFESLKTLEGYEPRDENRLFAYLALRNLLDTVEDYKFTSRGLDVFDAGIELHISGQLATRLSTIRPPILVPVQSPNAASPKWRRLEAKYAILEAGGGFVFGDEPISHRIDIALATDELGEAGDPIEPVFGIEVKRHLTDIKKDVEKLRRILLLHREKNWPLRAGAVLSFAEKVGSKRDEIDVLLRRRLVDFSQEHKDLELQACWIEREDAWILHPEGRWDEQDPTNKSKKTRYASCVFVSLTG